MHSGLLVPADWVWDGADGVAEVSFGEQAWMLGEDTSDLHALRLAFWPGPGGIYLKRIANDAESAIRRQHWLAIAVPLSPRGGEAVHARIQAWIVSDGPDLAHHPNGAVFRPATHGFHLFNNCHDQVADCLRSAGVPLGSWLPWRTAAGFRDEVAAALIDLERRGIRWVEPFEE